MPRLSPADQQQLERLVDLTLHRPRQMETGDSIRALETFTAGTSLEAVPLLVCLLSEESDVAVRVAAARVVARIVAATPAVGVADLDLRFRRSNSRSNVLTLDGIHGLASQAPEVQIPLTALLCSHGSGFVRESALRSLGTLTDGAELRFILLRLDDWVAPVQRLAIHAAEALLHPEMASLWVECLPLIERLDRRLRSRSSTLLNWALRLLKSPAGRDALLDGLGHSRFDVRRASWRLLVDSEAGVGRSHVSQGLGDADAVVQRLAFRAGSRWLVGEDRGWLAFEGLKNAQAGLRTEAIALLGAQPVETAGPHWDGALLDPSASVRGAARFALRRHGLTDFHARYRDALRGSSASRLAAALAGLGDLGDARDLQEVLRFVDEERPLVAAAALSAVNRLDGARGRVLALRMLLDPRPGVARTAGKVLRRSVSEAHVPELWRAVLGSAQPTTRRRAFNLILSVDRWTALTASLQAVASDGTDLAEWGRLALLPACRRLDSIRYLPPTATILACTAAYTTARTRLDPQARMHVESVLRQLE